MSTILEFMEQLGPAITMIKDLIGTGVSDGEINAIAGVVFAEQAREKKSKNEKWCNVLNDARNQVEEYVSHLNQDLHAENFCKVSSFCFEFLLPFPIK